MAVYKNTSKKLIRSKKVNKKVNKKAAHSSKGLLIFFLILALGVIGIWHCVDKPDVESINSKHDASTIDIDVGTDETIDPTIVNEENILHKEMLESEEKHTDTPKDHDAIKPEILGIMEAGDTALGNDDENISDEYPLYAVAFHFHTQIMDAPKADARVLASTRRGATFRLSNRISTDGCPRGWHKLSSGGYVCDGNGVQVTTQPITWENSPPPPKTNQPMPYSYRYVRRNEALQYWKVPNKEELSHVKSILTQLEALGSTEKKPENKSSSDPVLQQQASENKDKDALKAVLENATKKAEDSLENNSPDIDNSASSNEEKIAQESSEKEQNQDQEHLELPKFVHMQMKKGFYVSIADSISHEGITFQKTVRGRYLQADDLYAPKPSDYEGVLLSGTVSLPIAFVLNSGVRSLRQPEKNGPLQNAGYAERFSWHQVTGELKRGTNKYIQVQNHRIFPAQAVRIARQIDPPEGIQENERWIHVCLSSQTLVAYEGSLPVFATLVSTGKQGHETPSGKFRIYNKHVSVIMSNLEAGDEAYSIEDVPWTQFYDGGYALHAAFWHDRFGRVRSHGCINLSPADARRLFFWTGPHLNSNLHSIFSTSNNPGTLIWITE